MLLQFTREIPRGWICHREIRLDRNDHRHAIPTGGVESGLMTSDRPHESVQDAGGSAHVTPSSTNSSSNPLNTVFSFSQLEGKDAGQQVRQYNKWCRVPYKRICLQLAILNHMMGKAVSIKEGAEAVLYGNAAQLTVLTLLMTLIMC